MSSAFFNLISVDFKSFNYDKDKGAEERNPTVSFAGPSSGHLIFNNPFIYYFIYIAHAQEHSDRSYWGRMFVNQVTSQIIDATTLYIINLPV